MNYELMFWRIAAGVMAIIWFPIGVEYIYNDVTRLINYFT